MSTLLVVTGIVSVVRVPIGQPIDLNFIKSEINEYSIVQSRNGNDLSPEEEFVEVKADKSTGKVELTGKNMTSDNSTLKITNNVRFLTTSTSDGKNYDVARPLTVDFSITVSDVYAENLDIDGVGSGGNIDSTGDYKVITISADKITDDDKANELEVTASVSPIPITKAPLWNASDNKVITVDAVDPDDANTVKDINGSRKSKAKIHVKGVGETKLRITDRKENESKVNDEVTVKVVYPVINIQTGTPLYSLHRNKE